TGHRGAQRDRADLRAHRSHAHRVPLLRDRGGGYSAQGGAAGRVHAGGTLARHLDARRKRLGTVGTRGAIARVRDSGAGPGGGARGGRGPEAVRGSAERAGTIPHHGGVRGGSSGRPGGGIGGTCAGGGWNVAVGSGSRQRSGRDGAGAVAGGAAPVPRAAGHPRQELCRAAVPGGEPGFEELKGGTDDRLLSSVVLLSLPEARNRHHLIDAAAVAAIGLREPLLQVFVLAVD